LVVAGCPLEQGTITPEQFIDINQKIGGYDNNYDTTASPMVAEEPALTNDYRGGAVDETNNLKDVAVIDLRGPDAGRFHDAYRSWTTARDWSGWKPLAQERRNLVRGDAAHRRSQLRCPGTRGDGRLAGGRRGRSPRRQPGAEDRR
jgi:Tannase-like family of unknown function (DUF6351)